ncbi:MAG: ParA family protein [Raoultibacter sp.]|jgi:hypothetical protein
MNTQQSNYAKIPFSLAPITLVIGHYGVGKTNFSLNLAFDARKEGKEVTLIDLDVVNPYFRSSDYVEQLNAAGIRTIEPNFARSTLDVPSLSGAIGPALSSADENHLVILDIGGDDVGSTALGRYSETINNLPHLSLYLVNAYRNLTQTPEEAAEMLVEIEEKSHIKADGIINNSHLKQETTLETIKKSQDFAKGCAEKTGLPLLATSVPESIFDGSCQSAQEKSCYEPKSSVVLSRADLQKPYIVQVYVRTPWE